LSAHLCPFSSQARVREAQYLASYVREKHTLVLGDFNGVSSHDVARIDFEGMLPYRRSRQQLPGSAEVDTRAMSVLEGAGLTDLWHLVHGGHGETSLMLHLRPDLVHMEQYMDFVRQRQFRSTLLCRADLRLDRKILPKSFRGLYLAAPTVPTRSEFNVHSNSAEEFRAGPDVTLSASAPFMKAALACLGRAWPSAVAFDQLPAMAHSLLDPVVALDPERYAREAHTASFGFRWNYTLNFRPRAV
jgi:hypothetical protein